ncbi:zinc finger protein 70-like isoform X1 [Acipenser ruthenus]|uniref:zinc finger protein 70-like isoform X1 n=1 Tax=Acipenser ruthenus TaxID=7906 RepID=UPI0027410FF1|nr:zinc finger protein 70-like isoform X1 [Acipenser ruthenus]
MAAVYSVRAGSAGGAAGVAFLIENGGSPSQNDERLSRVGSGQAGLDLGAAGQPADEASRTMPTEEAMQTKAKQREDGLHTKLWEVWESAGETVPSGDSAKDEKAAPPFRLRRKQLLITYSGEDIGEEVLHGGEETESGSESEGGAATPRGGGGGGSVSRSSSLSDGEEEEEEEEGRSWNLRQRKECPRCGERFNGICSCSRHQKPPTRGGSERERDENHHSPRPAGYGFLGRGESRSRLDPPEPGDHLNITAEDPGADPLECPECGMCFSDGAEFRTHRQYHTDFEPMDEGGADLHGDESAFGPPWKRLQRQHEEPRFPGAYPFECKHCSKGFKHHTSLQKHMYLHSGARPFQCPQCPDAFAFEPRLRSHLKLHQLKPHRCPQCRKGYQEERQLREHLASHQRSKPYPCPLCPKTYRTAAELKDHSNTHTGERPYACPHCQKRFAHRGGLIVHSKTHSGGRKGRRALDRGRPPSPPPPSSSSSQSRRGQGEGSGQAGLRCLDCGVFFRRESELHEHYMQHARGEL